MSRYGQIAIHFSVKVVILNKLARSRILLLYGNKGFCVLFPHIFGMAQGTVEVHFCA